MTVNGNSPPAIVADTTPTWKSDYLFDRSLALVGFDLDGLSATSEEPEGSVRGKLKPGSRIHLRLHWKDRAAVPVAYTVFVQLVGTANNPATGNQVWDQRDAQPLAGKRPTNDWMPGEAVIDDYDLTVPASAPLGEYYLQVGLYDLATGQRLPATSAENRTGDSAILLRANVEK
jgi:hypothetical protein